MPRLVPTICTKKNFTHTSLPYHLHKINFTHWLVTPPWLQPSWILPCWIQLLPFWWQTPWISSLRFTKKHSHSTLTLTQANSIWLKLIHYHSTWWWQPSWILPSWILLILDSAILVFPLKLTHTCQDWFPPFAQKHFTHTSLHLHKRNFTHDWQPSCKETVTHSFWLNLMMAAILNSSILDSAILHKTLTQTNSISLQTHSFSLILMMAAILNSAILNLAILDSAILELSFKLSHLPRLVPTSKTLSLTLPFPPFALKLQFIGSHHLHKKNFTHSFWLNLMMAAILNSAILDFAILDSAILTLTLKLTHISKLIGSHSSSTMAAIFTLPSWISPPLDSAILKIFTHWFWLILDDWFSHLKFCTKTLHSHLFSSTQIAQRKLSLHSEFWLNCI